MSLTARSTVVALLLWVFTSACLAGGILEARFDLPGLQGNPFDFKQNDVRVSFVAPDGAEVNVPAFFDGGTAWRARHWPDRSGRWSVGGVTLNGSPAEARNLVLENGEVGAARKLGFVRIDPADPKRFVLDDGSVYYPLGYNLGWHVVATPAFPPLPETLREMGRAGVNWSRIWMDYWDDKNLDWSHDPARQPKIGTLDLAVARQWDEIVSAAEDAGIHFQLVLQHHGQYSTRTNPNWHLHPWNKANGGWLESPVQFFTDPRAIALTKAKYRYIVARWGYSPSIMAWELFNEIEYTDAFEKDLPAVSAWLGEMASFLRQQDPGHHLVTVSSRTGEPALWKAMDYYQAHVYPPDLLSALAVLDSEKLNRAYFYGEIGPGESGQPPKPAEVVRRCLWGSLMSGSSGAAMYWSWDRVETDHLLPAFTSAREFIRQSGLVGGPAMHPVKVSVETAGRVPLAFGPGSGWAPARSTEFTVHTGGAVDGLGAMSSYLQGEAHREMFPYADVKVDYPSAGTFAVRVEEVSAPGARLEMSLDGQPPVAIELANAPAEGGGAGGGTPARTFRTDTTVQIPVPSGPHTVHLRNSGPDWLRIRSFVLSPYSPEVGVLAKGDSDSAMLWAFRRDATVAGGVHRPTTTQASTRPAAPAAVEATLQIPGLSPGTYRAVWWDTAGGKKVSEETVEVTAGEGLRLRTPPISRDLAAWITRSSKVAARVQ